LFPFGIAKMAGVFLTAKQFFVFLPFPWGLSGYFKVNNFIFRGRNFLELAQKNTLGHQQGCQQRIPGGFVKQGYFQFPHNLLFTWKPKSFKTILKLKKRLT
jgi:hypothetical protein